MPKSAKSSEEKTPRGKYHVYLNPESVEEIQRLFPRTSLSEVMRHALDRVIEKARAKHAENLAKAGAPLDE